MQIDILWCGLWWILRIIGYFTCHRLNNRFRYAVRWHSASILCFRQWNHMTSFLSVFTTTVYRCEDNGRCAANLQEMNPPSPPLIILIAPSSILQCEIDGRAAQRFLRDYVSVPRSVLFQSLMLSHSYLATLSVVFAISLFAW
jgi:hypothetical protein